jgi:hypothetical protein
MTAALTSLIDVYANLSHADETFGGRKNWIDTLTPERCEKEARLFRRRTAREEGRVIVFVDMQTDFMALPAEPGNVTDDDALTDFIQSAIRNGRFPRLAATDDHGDPED